ncbi:DUF2061 domain-containing protein [Aquirufa ecclesiirivi]|uniref:DUF2061 domain-containing protein n=1 Tax=Aquirufa ecclesiirivi TaxID=2715124 RepID=UPI0023D83926|nr:DUF2061 domain-containing protein [Aquirufa ecclesiirivi]MDF0692478.1 DUF2061 domain-containing protein [Aquirufa ecclesiirivi]
MMKDITHIRHLSKSISWRVVGTIDTIVVSFVITGEPLLGLKIGISEVVTKLLLYYVHERIWFKIKFDNSKLRHLFKSISYRFFGSVDTFLLAWFISGNSVSGLKIGLTEVITKIILYYIHDEIWHKFKFGLPQKTESNEK